MSRAVLKQQLIFGKNTISMPLTSYVRHVHEQHGAIMLWYEAPTYTEEEQRTFYVLATGKAIPAAEEGFYNLYIGTIHLPDATVWHVYEVAPNGH